MNITYNIRQIITAATLMVLAVVLAVIACSAGATAQQAVEQCHSKGGVILQDDHCYIYGAGGAVKRLD